MSNENKTALMAEEILKKHSENSAKCEVIYNKTHEAIIDAMQEFASLQTQDKDKEIAELKDENKMYFKTMESIRDFFRDNNIKMNADNPDTLLTHFILKGQDYLNEYRFHLSTIESQQKEIEELKYELATSNAQLLTTNTVIIPSIQSQLSEVTKERDEAVRNAFNESRLTHPMVGFKHDTFEDYLKSLTPTKE